MEDGAGIQIADKGRRFAAFISYSHADAAIASKLQKRLERYRLPKHIALSHGNGSAALGQIFRDREDLAAAPSLSDAIRAAIATAEALVVICSPDAAASRWVSEEIALFRSLHPDRPILAAIVRGDPDEAFPSELTQGGTEPLAADLRKEADGQMLGFLKIVAGIAGVPLDTLVQRDAQRRVRRVMWITGAALAAMLIMGVMTTLAIQARNEAARQRAEAEGLVEYMLTDLRDKLKGVGRPEVMKTVNVRAMKYYQGQGDLAALPADSLERRARVLHAMGEDSDLMNDPVLAANKFSEAYRTTKALMDNDPQNPERIFAHAQSEYWMGQAAWRKRDRTTTARYWHGYALAAQKLLTQDKDQARANLEMGYALGNLCELYLNEKFDVAKAVDHCRRSINFEKRAATLAPDRQEIQLALANRYGWLADALLAQKLFREATSARDSEQRIIDRLVTTDPKNFELRYRKLSPEFGKILIQIESGHPREGADELTKMAARLKILSRESPNHMEVKRALIRVSYAKAKALLQIDPLAARSSLNEAKMLIDNVSKTSSQRDALVGFRKAIAEFERQLDTGGTVK